MDKQITEIFKKEFVKIGVFRLEELIASLGRNQTVNYLSKIVKISCSKATEMVDYIYHQKRWQNKVNHEVK